MSPVSQASRQPRSMLSLHALCCCLASCSPSASTPCQLPSCWLIPKNLLSNKQASVGVTYYKAKPRPFLIYPRDAPLTAVGHPAATQMTSSRLGLTLSLGVPRCICRLASNQQTCNRGGLPIIHSNSLRDTSQLSGGNGTPLWLRVPGPHTISPCIQDMFT